MALENAMVLDGYWPEPRREPEPMADETEGDAMYLAGCELREVLSELVNHPVIASVLRAGMATNSKRADDAIDAWDELT